MFPGQFIMPGLQGVVFEDNCVQDKLVAILQQVGASRVFLFTTPSLTRTPFVDHIQKLLGDRLVGTFTDSVAHTPESVVAKALGAVKASGADCLITFGGSSVVDLGKAVALTMAEGDDYSSMKVSFSPETGPVVPPLEKPKIPHIAIPTTLSSSEYSFAAAITDEATGEKNLFADFKLTPKWVFQDATLCLATPNRLWVSSGMKIFSDCLESLCSTRAKPFTDSLALGALKLLNENLPASMEKDSLRARAHCLNAGFMAMSMIHNSSIGMVGALRHQLGGGQKLSHGEASTIVLPHVLRWNSEVAAEPIARAARFLGLVDNKIGDLAAVDALIARIADLVQGLELPSTLSELNVPEDALRPIAEHAASDISMMANPRQAKNSDEVLEVLQAAY